MFCYTTPLPIPFPYEVPKEEAVAISGRLLQILSDHGPLTVGNTWNHAKVQHTLSTYVITCIK